MFSFYHSYCAADDNEDTGHTSHLVVFTGQSWFVFDLVLCVCELVWARPAGVSRQVCGPAGVFQHKHTGVALSSGAAELSLFALHISSTPSLVLFPSLTHPVYYSVL